MLVRYALRERRMAVRCLTTIILLLAIPQAAFGDAPSTIRDFVDGHRTTFSTKGHPKANGVNFTIAYPNGWKAAEGTKTDENGVTLNFRPLLPLDALSPSWIHSSLQRHSIGFYKAWLRRSTTRLRVFYRTPERCLRKSMPAFGRLMDSDILS